MDSIFEEFPEISAVQTKVYHMLKCHLSVISHPSVSQFQDIDLSNYDFNRVAGADFNSFSAPDSRPDLSTHADLNDTYYSTYSQAYRQAYRVTERLLGRLTNRDRVNSCPDISSPLDKDFEDLSNSNWWHTTAREPPQVNPIILKTDQSTQTVPKQPLIVKDSGAQYSSPSDDSDSSSSDSESEIEGTENITVAKQYITARESSQEDLYTAPTPPNKKFRMSTPEPAVRQQDKEPAHCPLKEIIHHKPALTVSKVDIVVAPGGHRQANIHRGQQRVNAAMAAGRRNPPLNLQGVDPALVQILTMMQNRDANRDNSRKKFIMFPKDSFTRLEKKKAQGHWAKFSKYLEYQAQQGTILRDPAHLPDIKAMFKLTLQDIALGWSDTESPNWLTEDQMKQAFLKHFNPWGDMQRQQQDAWNKLKFNMTKDNVDAFVVNMKMLASILGLDNDAIREKFKDIFPDPNIEAALIAMEDFAAMQAKAKQLVQIYKPAHDNARASAAILVHTANTANDKTNPKVTNIN